MVRVSDTPSISRLVIAAARTHHQAGVCIHFAEKVPSRLSRRGYSALTMTIEDLEGLTRAPGEDRSQVA
jgi:hypothetical protein